MKTQRDESIFNADFSKVTDDCREEMPESLRDATELWVGQQDPQRVHRLSTVTLEGTPGIKVSRKCLQFPLDYSPSLSPTRLSII